MYLMVKGGFSISDKGTGTLFFSYCANVTFLVRAREKRSCTYNINIDFTASRLRRF
jgi:hypothetical protein